MYVHVHTCIICVVMDTGIAAAAIYMSGWSFQLSTCTCTWASIYMYVMFDMSVNILVSA